MSRAKRVHWKFQQIVLLGFMLLHDLVDSRSVGTRSIFSQPSSTNNIELVNILFRHGDRTPLSESPITSFHKETWTLGLGQLTPLGMQEQFKLGSYFRSRYMLGNPYSLLNPSYTPKEIYVRSTDVDRTLMSAEANMAGLYPPSGDQVWNPFIQWQPVPVHTIPLDTDNLLYVWQPCPTYDDAYQNLLQSSQIRTFENNNQAFYEFLMQKTGLQQMDFTTAGSIYDTLFCELQHGFSLPAWVNKTTFAKLEACQTLVYSVPYQTALLSRLTGGVLLGELLTNMQMKANGSMVPPQQKMFVFSAHDGTISSLLSAMGVYDGVLPQYADSVMVELHNTNGLYSVQVWYRNNNPGQVKDAQLLVLPGCSGDCPLDQFISITQNTIPVNWAEECQLAD